MGLFSSDETEDKRLFQTFLSALLKSWNSCQGNVYEHRASIATDCIDHFLSLSRQVMDVQFPDKPSAFKRLGTWLVMAQHIQPFSFVGLTGESLGPKGDCDWMPRIAVSGLPIAAQKMTVFTADEPVTLEPFVFPSPHFQAEMISVLRNYRLTAIKDISLVSLAMLAERAFSASLILEASYYVHTLENWTSSVEPSRHLQGKIEGCLKNFNATQIEDIVFNDEDALVMATDDGH